MKAIISRPHVEQIIDTLALPELPELPETELDNDATFEQITDPHGNVDAAAKVEDANNEDSRTAVVAWTAAQNKLVDDPVRRLRDVCLTRQSAVLCHTKLSCLMSLRISTISSQAKDIAQKDKEPWHEYHDAMTQRQRDPEMFKLKYKDHLGVARRFLDAAVHACDAICGTPVALGQLANRSDWKPDFIVLDEAARMQESISAILLAKFPRAAGLLIGDALQFSPMSLTNSDTKYSFLPRRVPHNIGGLLPNHGPQPQFLQAGGAAQESSTDGVRVGLPPRRLASGLLRPRLRQKPTGKLEDVFEPQRTVSLFARMARLNFTLRKTTGRMKRCKLGKRVFL